MERYEDTIMRELEGETPKEKYEYLLAIKENLTTSKKTLQHELEKRCIDNNGHSLIDLVRFNNGRSCYGDKICQKCGLVYSWQYDYAIDNTNHESRPY